MIRIQGIILSVFIGLMMIYIGFFADPDGWFRPLLGGADNPNLQWRSLIGVTGIAEIILGIWTFRPKNGDKNEE